MFQSWASEILKMLFVVLLTNYRFRNYGRPSFVSGLRDEEEGSG